MRDLDAAKGDYKKALENKFKESSQVPPAPAPVSASIEALRKLAAEKALPAILRAVKELKKHVRAAKAAKTRAKRTTRKPAKKASAGKAAP